MGQSFAASIIGLVILIRLSPVLFAALRLLWREAWRHPRIVRAVAVSLAILWSGYTIGWPWNIAFGVLGLAVFLTWTKRWIESAERIGIYVEPRGRMVRIRSLYFMLHDNPQWGQDVWANDDRSTALDWIVFIGHLRIAKDRTWIKHHAYGDGWILHWVPGTDESWWTRPRSR